MAKGRPGKVKWTAEQEEMIKEEYATLGPKKLAEKMGVDRVALINRAYYLGIKSKVKFRWTDEMLATLKARYVSDGPTKLSKELGVPYNLLFGMARRLNIPNTRKTPPKGFTWNAERIAAVKDRYVQEGAEKLAEELGVAIDTVRRQASSMGLHTIAGHAIAGRRRAEKNNRCNIRYFDQWSPNMAYILGFLFADGHITKEKSSIGALISRKDEAVLWFIKKELQARASVDHPKPVKGGIGGPSSSLAIHSTVMVERLIELGLKPRKTFNDDPYPEVPDKMAPHFLRGVLDGDGCVCTYQDKGRDCCSVSFVGSPRFIQGVRDSLIRLAGIAPVKVGLVKGKTADTATVAWTSAKDLKALYQFFYPEGGYDFCYERKRQKLQAWVENPRELRKPWAPFEDEMVRRYYYVFRPGQLGALIDRSADAVCSRAKFLGVLKPKPSS